MGNRAFLRRHISGQSSHEVNVDLLPVTESGLILEGSEEERPRRQHDRSYKKAGFRDLTLAGSLGGEFSPFSKLFL